MKYSVSVCLCVCERESKRKIGKTYDKHKSIEKNSYKEHGVHAGIQVTAVQGKHPAFNSNFDTCHILPKVFQSLCVSDFCLYEM